MPDTNADALTSDLRLAARAAFDRALAAADARAAVLRAASFDGRRLRIFGDEFDLGGGRTTVYTVALGKAAAPMAAALDELLGEGLREGVLSAPPARIRLSGRWRVFEGGHPLPNGESEAAAHAAFGLLRRADGPAALVVFLVSGGGSAMMELPRGEAVALADMREMNRVLVTCGASIAEVNAVRRAVSAVKGGGLARAAPRAAQVTLIVSDTADAEGRAVASGPTFAGGDSGGAQEAGGWQEANEIVERYGLAARLPGSILRALRSAGGRGGGARPGDVDETGVGAPPDALRRHHVLLDNRRAVEAAADSARASGFAVEIARDVADEPVGEGARLLVSRLLELRGREAGRAVCLVSGGEFACPVRGGGVGGRSSETVLRCALELDARAPAPGGGDAPRFVVLGAGTDGVDGNSPAAGAVCDEMTARRARSRGLDPQRALDASDAYTLFAALGDALTTGPTGTNVRDLRILMAK